MNLTFRLLGAWAGLCFAMPALAGESAPLKCAANQDRVWLYDSLISFEVQAKVKCGETVEILARQKGFVKIRTQSGAEGYVPEIALPKPLTADANEEKPAEELSLAAQARAARAARGAAAQPSASSAAAAPVAVAAIPLHEKPAEIKVAAPRAQDRSSQSLQPVAASANATDAVSMSITTAESSVSAAEKPAATQPSPNSTSRSAAASPNPAESTASRALVQKGDKAVTSKAKTTQPPPSKPARPAVAPPSSTSSASNIGPAPAVRTATAASGSAASGSGQYSVAMASVTASPTPRAITAVETSSATLRAEPVATTRTIAATTEPESEDYPERVIEDESANPSCGTYFSAYGLSPMQYKWIVENRQKKYPGICPASSPNKVDFVVIFTHDVAFYNSTMPTAVHTDKGGFSDWNPMTRADDTVVSASELDKSKHEYVWVFQMKRGAFDPARFSPRRRPQFTKVESNGLGSHAAPRSIDDAFQFIQSAPAR